MVLEMQQKVKYAGICTDMRGVRHFWRKVPEMREGGWNASRIPKKLWLSRSYPKENA
jgi:hypothetical protein